jgi:hypothetical protein
MSAEKLSQTTGHKVHDAAERAKEGIDSATHDAMETIRGGAELFKADVADLKDAVSKQVHHDAADADARRRNAEMNAREHVALVTKEVNDRAQADAAALRQPAKK